jgi:hypothetical protein
MHHHHYRKRPLINANGFVHYAKDRRAPQIWNRSGFLTTGTGQTGPDRPVPVPSLVHPTIDDFLA